MRFNFDMKYAKYLLLLLLIPGFLTLTPLFAQEPLSLKAMIEEARERNPEIQAFRQRVKEKELRAKAEGALDDPLLKIEIEDIPTERPFNLGNSMLTRYTFSQMFPFPGKLSLKERMAMKEVLMASEEARWKELEIIAALKETYYDYAFISESMKVTKGIKEILSEMARIAEARYSLGLASQQDIIKAQVEITLLINEILTLEAEKGGDRARLKAIRNRDPSSPIGEPESVPRQKVDIKADELIERALDKNPGLRGMAFEIDVRETAIDLANKNYYPDFMIGVAPIQKDGRFDTWDAMFTVNIPIWRKKYDNMAGEAKIGKEVLISKLKAERNIKAMEVKEGAIKVEAAARIRSLYETGLMPQAELSFGFSLTNYQTGKIDFLALLDSERTLKRTKIEYIRILSDYNKIIASLEKIIGDEIAKE